MFTRVDVCATQPLCRGIQSAIRRVTRQRPRRRRRRRVYFGPFRNNPDNNGVDQIVTRPMDSIHHATNDAGRSASAAAAQRTSQCTRSQYVGLQWHIRKMGLLPLPRNIANIPLVRNST